MNWKFWQKKQQKTEPTPPPPAPKKKIFFNRRYGVYTAYLPEDLEGAGGGMLAPRKGLMIFTDDETIPSTGTVEGLRYVAKVAERELQEVSEYAFYTLGRGIASQEEDIRDYGHLVLRFEEALQRVQAA